MSKYSFVDLHKPGRNSAREYDGFHFDGRHMIFSKGLKADFGDSISLGVDKENEAVCISISGDYKIKENQGRKLISAPHLKTVLSKGRYLAVDVDHDGGAVFV